MLNKLIVLLRRTGLTLVVLSALCLSGEVFAKDKPAPSPDNPIIAKIGSEIVRVRDIEDKLVNNLRKQLYEALNAKLRAEILDRLAKKRPEFSLPSKIAVSDREVQKFYKERQLQRHGSLKDLTPRIKEYLESQALDKRRQELCDKALKQGLATSYLKEPNDFLITAPVGSAYLRGNQKAKVILLEFSDYQCPYCSRVQTILAELMEKYKGKVIFGYRHLPLSFHQEADEAAIAAECARDQGQFNAYHKTLFQNQRKQAVSDLKRYARQIKIKNPGKFDDCLDKETYRERVKNDLRTAAQLGINGAPGFVVGIRDKKRGTVRGEIISGALPKDHFIKLIEKYLKKTER